MNASKINEEDNPEEINDNAAMLHESQDLKDEQISNTNLIINYLPQSMNQEAFYELFTPIGAIKNCRLMTDKCSGRSIGYGFVDFENPNDAEYAINIMDGLKIENKTIKVSYARPSSNEIKFANLYITGFSKRMTQDEFDNLFSSFGKIITSRILYEIIPCSVNETIKVSKGVGFIRFSRRDEAEHAINELNNTKLKDSNIVLTVKFANNPYKKKKVGNYASVRHQEMRLNNRNAMNNYNTINSSSEATHAIQQTNMMGYSLTRSTLVTNINTAVLGNRVHTYAWSIYVSNLHHDTVEQNLWKLFGPFGAVLNVNVIYNKDTNNCKGIAFVTMAKYEEAVVAIESLNGKFIRNRKMQVSFKKIGGKIIN